MNWSPWITHDYCGFPSHILKPGYLVEIELISCQGNPRGKGMFTVGEDNCTFDKESLYVEGNPIADEAWSVPDYKWCLQEQSCFLVVGKYRYKKPDEQKSKSEEAIDMYV